MPIEMPDEDLRTGILALLPEDGTPVLNRAMRVMLARRFERSVDDEVFFAARDKLFDAGKVGRLRGQGGQIFLTQPVLALRTAKKQAEAKDVWTEAKLMEPLRRRLSGASRARARNP